MPCSQFVASVSLAAAARQAGKGIAGVPLVKFSVLIDQATLSEWSVASSSLRTGIDFIDASIVSWVEQATRLAHGDNLRSNVTEGWVSVSPVVLTRQLPLLRLAPPAVLLRLRHLCEVNLLECAGGVSRLLDSHSSEVFLIRLSQQYLDFSDPRQGRLFLYA